MFLCHNVNGSGGTFVRAMELAKQVTTAGHGVTLVTTSRHARVRWEDQRVEGVRVLAAPAAVSGRFRSGWDGVDLASRVWRVLLSDLGQVDVLHAFDTRPTVILPALLARRRARAQLVVDWADWWGRGGTIEERPTGTAVRVVARVVETFFEEAFRTRADATTTISSALAARAESLGVPRHTIHRLPQGCDTQSIVPLPLREARARCGLPQDVPIVGYMGAMFQRDASLLLEAFSRLRQQVPDAQLMLVGKPGLRLPEVDGLLPVGFVPRELLSTHLGACNLFLLPMVNSIANRGRWPSRLNDYLAAGRPVVATPVGDVPELFTRYQVGALGWVEDDTFVEACVELLTDSHRSGRLGENARRVAETELDWSVVGRQLLSLYEDVRLTSVA